MASSYFVELYGPCSVPPDKYAAFRRASDDNSPDQTVRLMLAVAFWHPEFSPLRVFEEHRADNFDCIMSEVNHALAERFSGCRFVAAPWAVESADRRPDLVISRTVDEYKQRHVYRQARGWAQSHTYRSSLPALRAQLYKQGFELKEHPEEEAVELSVHLRFDNEDLQIDQVPLNQALHSQYPGWYFVDFVLEDGIGADFYVTSRGLSTPYASHTDIVFYGPICATIDGVQETSGDWVVVRTTRLFVRNTTDMGLWELANQAMLIKRPGWTFRYPTANGHQEGKQTVGMPVDLLHSGVTNFIQSAA